MSEKKFKICLTGGGTGGSVTPLLGLYDYLVTTPDFNSNDFIWLGSRNGLEKAIVTEKGIAYLSIFSGKLRRYFSLQNILDILFIKIGFLQSLYFLFKYRPNIIISAGSFVAVPVVVAGWFLRIPSIVHQMDVRPGLANKIMAKFASTITVTFDKSLSNYGDKAILAGNIVRPEIKQAPKLDKISIKKELKMTGSKPVLLVVGGGTGASGINKLIINNQTELEKICQMIHQTGADKEQGVVSKNYQAVEFLSAQLLAKYYSIADLVISRAGLGFISELSALSKPSVVIPMPNSHQEDNANLLKEKKASYIVDQNISSENFVSAIKDLLNNLGELDSLGRNIHNIMSTDAEIVFYNLIKKYIKY